MGKLFGGIIIVYVVCTIAWGVNVYKLTQCGFEAPYKAEAIRVVGVVVPPVSIVTAWMDFGK